MRRIAVINQKGGVGKTTTTVNLGAALARLGERVLICDLDAQCNLTVHVDVDPSAEQASLYELFHGRAGLHEVARPTKLPRLDVAPASIDLAGVELELVNAVGREVLLRDAIESFTAEHGERYDYILMDCPPSLGLVSLNALVACDELIVPIQAEFFALQGLGKLLEIVEVVKRRLNPALRIAAMVSCRHDPTTNLGKAVISDIQAHFGEILLTTVIRRNVKLAEAPSHGLTIFEYDAESRGAEDYLNLARELLGENDGSPLGRRQPVLEETSDDEVSEDTAPDEAGEPSDTEASLGEHARESDVAVDDDLLHDAGEPRPRPAEEPVPARDDPVPEPPRWSNASESDA